MHPTDYDLFGRVLAFVCNDALIGFNVFSGEALNYFKLCSVNLGICGGIQPSPGGKECPRGGRVSECTVKGMKRRP